MKLFKIVCLGLALFSTASAYSAGQIGTNPEGYEINVINPGFNGNTATAVSFVGVDLITAESACQSKSAALSNDEANNQNKNYREIYSLLLAAKVSSKKVLVQIDGCYKGYPRISEAALR